MGVKRDTDTSPWLRDLKSIGLDGPKDISKIPSDSDVQGSLRTIINAEGPLHPSLSPFSLSRAQLPAVIMAADCDLTASDVPNDSECCCRAQGPKVTLRTACSSSQKKEFLLKYRPYSLSLPWEGIKAFNKNTVPWGLWVWEGLFSGEQLQCICMEEGWEKIQFRDASLESSAIVKVREGRLN